MCRSNSTSKSIRQGNESNIMMILEVSEVIAFFFCLVVVMARRKIRVGLLIIRGRAYGGQTEYDVTFERVRAPLSYSSCGILDLTNKRAAPFYIKPIDIDIYSYASLPTFNPLHRFSMTISLPEPAHFQSYPSRSQLSMLICSDFEISAPFSQYQSFRRPQYIFPLCFSKTTYPGISLLLALS